MINSDQGSRFTHEDYLKLLKSCGVQTFLASQMSDPNRRTVKVPGPIWGLAYFRTRISVPCGPRSLLRRKYVPLRWMEFMKYDKRA